MHSEARRLIEAIGMAPHPEGGYYRETFRSSASVTTHDGTVRSAATSIYFLLTAESFSAFHRIASDETWHFYRGDPLTIEIIAPNGTHESRILGTGEAFQTTVSARAYFASHVDRANGYALVGCDVAPGFEFEDFELAVRSELAAEYPAHAELIERFTRR
jgi:predicted cupin superfamily sugar epimerase